MTVSAVVRKAGPTPGNSSATVFPFDFKVFAESDLQVVLTVIATGAQTILTLDDPAGYTVSLNADQNANPGGSVTYDPASVPMPSTQSLTITSVVPQVQGTHIINGGAFFANNIEDAVDKSVINVQDLAAKVGASIQFPAADSSALNAVLPAAAARASTTLGFDASGNVLVGAVTGSILSAAWLAVVQAATLALGRTAMGMSTYFQTLIAAANAAALRLLLGFSAYFDTLVAAADAAALRTLLGLGSAAVEPTTTFWSAGDVKLTIKTVADAGWVLMNDGTIGDATSGGTTRANADTSALFALLWTNTVDADCAVSTGRGVSAAADFAAHKTIALPKALGRALAAYGTGSGLTARTMAHIVGAETHVHTQQGTFSSGNQTQASAADTAGGVNLALNSHHHDTTISGDTTSTSSMQPTVFLNVMIKL